MFTFFYNVIVAILRLSALIIAIIITAGLLTM